VIIDCHCHAGKGDGLTGPWDTNAPLQNYLCWAKEACITKTVLFAAFNSNYTKANAEVAKIVNSDRRRFYGFAFVNAAKDAGNIFNMVKVAVHNIASAVLKHIATMQPLREKFVQRRNIFNCPYCMM
jgi:uncharacterized membrane protein